MILKILPGSLLLFFILFSVCGNAKGDEIYEDARDNWSLLDQSPLNRQLHEQLASPAQQSRLWKKESPFAFLVDASTGGQQTLPGTEYDQTRYHGYFIFNGYGTYRLLDTLDVNLNLNFLNPSFCDGYHKSFQLLAGMSFHFNKKLFPLLGSPVVFDALLMDLDTLTFGEGLLIEQIPLEGFSFALSWKDASLSAHIAARVFWHYDDLLMIPLRFFKGRLALLAAFWYFTEPSTEGDGAFDIFRTSNNVQQVFPYVGVSAHYEWWSRFRIAGEYLANTRHGRIASAGLFRADYKENLFGHVNIHLGYQFRFYQRAFAPLEDISMATTAPQVPARENMYVTNSFEYMSVSPWFHQLSHTVMNETQLNVTRQLQIYYELEYWYRWSKSKQGDNRVLFVSGTKRAPGIWQDIFYNVGFRYRLFHNLPHRVALFVSNKWVASDTEATTPMPVRYVNDPLFGFELEVFL